MLWATLTRTSASSVWLSTYTSPICPKVTSPSTLPSTLHHSLACPTRLPDLLFLALAALSVSP